MNGDIDPRLVIRIALRNSTSDAIPPVLLPLRNLLARTDEDLP